MKIKILKFSIKGLKGYSNNYLEVDLTNQSRGGDSQDLDNLFGSIYKNKVIAFPGINSSGKTTFINLFDWLIKFYQGKRTANDLVDIARLLDEVQVEMIFYLGHGIDAMIYKINSNFIFDKDLNKYIVFDEFIYVKEVNTTINKTNLFKFSNDLPNMTRNDYKKIFKQIEADRLKSKEDARKMLDSFSVFDNDKTFVTVFGLLEPLRIITNKAELNDQTFINVAKININIINYLDKSINILEKMDKDFYKIKFINDDETIISLNQLLKVLSRGTKKAYNMYETAMRILKTGGYLLIDEVEMSLNTELVKDLIMMFYNEDLNINDATLMITTHYNEILDFIPRNDAIYICYKDDFGDMNIKNFSLAGNRNDINKVAIFKSGTFIENTALEYVSYNKVITDIREYVNDKE